MDKPLLLAFYGDDFTGSTDALEFLSRAGAKTALFIEPPTADQLGRYQGLDAIGVAGLTRSMPPETMETTLKIAFAELRKLGTRHVHYKVCSTFDSSPAIGSIGRAIDVGHALFQRQFVPLLVAAPSLGRYCAFGNLFARLGTGSYGTVYRLDRHPSMSKHPVTPAEESDIRLHLARQTDKATGLIDLTQLTTSQQFIADSTTKLIENGAQVILFDAMEDTQLRSIGELIDSYGNPDTPFFSVGSSGVDMALGSHWAQTGALTPVTSWPDPGSANPLLVLSGSCSPVTAGQIAWARANGFAEVILDAQTIHDSIIPDAAVAGYVQQAIAHVGQGANVIVHTAGGAVRQHRTLSSEKLGTALGQIAREIVRQTRVKRVVVAGGDTSSYAARAMGIEAVEIITALVPGAPLCRATAPGSPLDGLEVNFKGGQVGAPDYFGILRAGRVS
ncbi:four-carbon acid sugar kinase family protein [Fibrella forsythiae]|uniref:Four-carbon acid sugar kinase family protein n=1 Tax=Fibrella forsythiae TaxID=2817061 RepID=A0ABS3JD06_9BACT|nr:four-carbon acid sugar kinase family protein [Fibrella forsythiae]MBO0947890.1 four-carbon acid sugar kinase family protein [Fibrella forsythiae]